MDLTAAERQSASNTIVAHLIASAVFQQATTVTAYASTRAEVSLDGLWPASAHTLLLPRVDGHHLRWHPSTVLPKATSDHGIREPDVRAYEHTGPVDLWLIPAVGIDDRGYRLGQGGGFYDRAMASSSGLRVAVVFECQRVVLVPTEAHDLPVDAVVTENGWRFTSRA